MRSRNIQADIIEYLSDGKIHTMQAIADAVEVSYMTVRRHIQTLSYHYDIDTFSGGGGLVKGGVRMKLQEKITVERLSGNELQLIIENLSQLQNSSVNFKKFIKDLTLIKENKENNANERA